MYDVLPDVLDYIYSPARRATMVDSISSNFAGRQEFIHTGYMESRLLPPWEWSFEGSKRTVETVGGSWYRDAMARLRAGAGV